MTQRDGRPNLHLEDILRYEVQELRLALATRQIELRLVTENRGELRRTSGRLRAALDDAETLASDRSVEIVGLKGRLSDTEMELDTLCKQKDELEGSLGAMTARAREAANAGAAAEARVTEVSQRVGDLDVALTKEQFRAEELFGLLVSTAASSARQQALMQSMQRNVCWRIAAPLRWISRILGIREHHARVERGELAELESSQWFDGEWYLQVNPDVDRLSMDPARHYLVHGALEGRDPGPDFNTRFYMETYLDVTASGLNPLIHFIRHGSTEGRLPRPHQKEVQAVGGEASGMRPTEPRS